MQALCTVSQVMTAGSDWPLLRRQECGVTQNPLLCATKRGTYEMNAGFHATRVMPSAVPGVLQMLWNASASIVLHQAAMYRPLLLRLPALPLPPRLQPTRNHSVEQKSGR